MGGLGVKEGGGNLRFSVNAFNISYGSGIEDDGLAHLEDFVVGLGNADAGEHMILGSREGEREEEEKEGEGRTEDCGSHGFVGLDMASMKYLVSFWFCRVGMPGREV